MKKLFVFFLFVLLLTAGAVYFFKIKTSDNEPLPRKRLVLITGCARSGTKYTSQMLRACGLDVRHEKDGKMGIASWPMVVDSDTTPWGPGSNEYKFTHTFQQVRDPLKTIASASNEPPESWEFIRRFVPEISMDDPKMVKGAKYWYYWNLLAEKKAEWTYRIENLDNELEEMSRRLGLVIPKDATQRVPKIINTRGYTDKYTWQDLNQGLDPVLYANIVALAKKYGYLVEEQ